MKAIYTLIVLLSMNVAFGQDFKLDYWTTGLGSNATWLMPEEDKDCASGLKVEISGTSLSYSVCEKTGDFKIDTATHDTIWTETRQFYHLKFRQSSIDSIRSILDTLHGKYIYRSNPNIQSGAVFNYYIELEGKCTQFVMKNTYDNRALQITLLINSYLDEKYHIYVPDLRWAVNKYDKPLIKSCPDEGKGSYREVLEQDYEIIRKQ